MENSYSEFKSSILHLLDKRVHKITNSLGVYDAYKYIRKHKWFNIGRRLTEKEFYSIIREVNKILAEHLSKGEDIIFPCKMGQLEIRKRNSIPTITNGGDIKVTYAIDWNKTLKLWYEDKESFDNKTLVKIPEKNIFRIVYSKRLANYYNKSFMEFQVSRNIKRELKQNIKNNQIDAFNVW